MPDILTIIAVNDAVEDASGGLCGAGDVVSVQIGLERASDTRDGVARYVVYAIVHSGNCYVIKSFNRERGKQAAFLYADEVADAIGTLDFQGWKSS